MQAAAAETLALKALTHVAGDGDALVRFLTISGLEPDDLRRRAADRELLAAVLDFLLADESLCAAFLEAEALDAPTLHAARRALPGAHQM